MRIGLTMMVRDEVDIIRLSLDHYLAQGIDRIIVTDNGSVDGTEAILEEYARAGRIELHHDPRHHKQQAATVTGMARDLARADAVDWVINADADEFLVPADRSRSIREVIEAIPPSIYAFEVKVVNMLGPLVLDGWDTSGSIWRDHRSERELAAAGLFAHPSPNAIHVARSDIQVAQGNHAVSIKGSRLPDELKMEVLHFPWRSWLQYRDRVDATGRAYAQSEATSPSPNHHGLRDYKRLNSGLLLPLFAARLPPATTLTSSPSFVADDFVARWAMERGRPDFQGMHPSLQEGLHAAGIALISEQSAKEDLTARYEEQRVLAVRRTDELSELATRLSTTRAELHLARSRRAAVMADRLARMIPPIRRSR